ncbi:RNA 2',3'-cyclic phosphodiesterase [Schlegelella sp. S2-27]|uniref:RNA 2',3'-cyclic phosphodiesterase n=1 Tax=Caldimonas mangrovi TaxID=2944811 RepID=A0ABT0YH86_9BURK|nr:RNA 2',3'-cyclic phosphodiesterase [Caldimonas mangrovi]MCM5678099.1 RNA 2',3'-cyclic phosphodiesterase [Caldimonas mangrovi]
MSGVSPPPASPARLFFALWPDEAVRRELVAIQDAWQWPRSARRVPPGRLHLTLHFLAQVPALQVAALMRQADVPLAPFELTLDAAGLWPGGVAWLRPSTAPAALLDLQRRLGAALQAFGCELDTRAYEPHVTLARDARAAMPPAGVQVRWQVDGYALVESRLEPPGGYTVLRRYGAGQP